jgi:hypothetical protein
MELVLMIVLVLAGIGIVFGMIIGAMRGLKKSTIRLITLVAAFAVALIFTPMVTRIAMEQAGEMVLGTVFDDPTPAVDGLVTAAASDLYPLVGVFINPLVFFGLFISLRIIFFFTAYLILVMFFGRRKKDPATGKKKSKKPLFGMLVGLACGFLCFFALIMPIHGYIDVVAQLQDMSFGGEEEESDTLRDILTIEDLDMLGMEFKLDPFGYNESFANSAFGLFGFDRQIFGMLTRAKLETPNGHKYNVRLRHEVSLINDFMKALNEMDGDVFGDLLNNLGALDELVEDTVFKSDLMLYTLDTAVYYLAQPVHRQALEQFFGGDEDDGDIDPASYIGRAGQVILARDKGGDCEDNVVYVNPVNDSDPMDNVDFVEVISILFSSIAKNPDGIRGELRGVFRALNILERQVWYCPDTNEVKSFGLMDLGNISALANLGGLCSCCECECECGEGILSNDCICCDCVYCPDGEDCDDTDCDDIHCPCESEREKMITDVFTALFGVYFFRGALDYLMPVVLTPLAENFAGATIEAGYAKPIVSWTDLERRTESAVLARAIVNLNILLDLTASEIDLINFFTPENTLSIGNAMEAIQASELFRPLYTAFTNFDIETNEYFFITFIGEMFKRGDCSCTDECDENCDAEPILFREAFMQCDYIECWENSEPCTSPKCIIIRSPLRANQNIDFSKFCWPMFFDEMAEIVRIFDSLKELQSIGERIEERHNEATKDLFTLLFDRPRLKKMADSVMFGLSPVDEQGKMLVNMPEVVAETDRVLEERWFENLFLAQKFQQEGSDPQTIDIIALIDDTYASTVMFGFVMSTGLVVELTDADEALVIARLQADVIEAFSTNDEVLRFNAASTAQLFGIDPTTIFPVLPPLP